MHSAIISIHFTRFRLTLRNQIKLLSLACGIALAGLVLGCGSSTSSKQSTVTGLTKRALITNSQSGSLVILDAQKDRFSSKAFPLGSPGKMVVGGGFTVIQETATNSIAIFDNTKESVAFTPPTSSIPFDVAISPDGKTAWAATRNPGFVQAYDTSNGNIIATISTPNAVRLVMSPQGSTLLVFADNPQNPALQNTDAFYVIKTANVSNSTPATPVRLSPGDQPFTAVFSSDTQAFILNCGGECGGVNPANSTTLSAASVVAVDFSGAAPATGNKVAVSAATVGLLSGPNLFVAGTPPTTPAGFCSSNAGLGSNSCGILQVINTGTFTAGAPVAITDGLHRSMALTSNNRLYVGAIGCTVAPSGPSLVRGCLSIFDTGTQSVTFPSESSFRQDFGVTSLQPISGRSVVYVVQGGELDFFDITTNAVATNITPIDISGNAIFVVQIDP
jgi:hypothetical protein